MSNTADTMTADRFGKILRQARKEAGLIRRAVAEAVGVCESTCANYEEGGSMPSPAIIYKLGELLGLSAEVVELAQAESRHRRSHHSYRTSPAKSVKPKPPGPVRRLPQSCGLTNAEQIAAIAWEANRTGVSFDAVRQTVDNQGGGDIFRRYIVHRKERQARLRKEAEERRKKRGGRIA